MNDKYFHLSTFNTFYKQFNYLPRDLKNTHFLYYLNKNFNKKFNFC